MKEKGLCHNCNEFWECFNKDFVLEPFLSEHYKSRYCTKKFELLNGRIITCLEIYVRSLSYFINPSFFHIQPERSKREDSLLCCDTRKKLSDIFKDYRFLDDIKKDVEAWKAECEMRCSEHCGNTVREVR